MAAVKKSISLPDSLAKLATKAAKDEHYPTFSHYVQECIKADLARRQTEALHLAEQPIKYAVPGRSKIPPGKRAIEKGKAN